MTDFHDIMYVIGRGRFVRLLLLIAVNAALFAGIYYYLEPQAVNAEGKVTEVSQDITRLRSEIDGMPALLEQYKKNEVKYEKLVEGGFVGEQSRISSRKIIDYFREKSGVSGIEYEFSPIKRFENDYRTAALPDELVTTDIKISINSAIDLEVFAFLQYFEETLPGMLVLRKINVERNDTELNNTALMSVSKGEKIDFITAEAEYEWLTLSPRIVAPVQ